MSILLRQLGKGGYDAFDPAVPGSQNLPRGTLHIVSERGDSPYHAASPYAGLPSQQPGDFHGTSGEAEACRDRGSRPGR